MHISLSDFVQNEQNASLKIAATTLLLLIPEEGKFAKAIRVLIQNVDLNTLDTGYYLRFIALSEDKFHFYGIEVVTQGKVLVHENIRKKEFEHHADHDFKGQLTNLHIEEKVVFRTAAYSDASGSLIPSDVDHYSEVSGSVIPNDVDHSEPKI